MKKYLMLVLLFITLKVTAQNAVTMQLEKMQDAQGWVGTWKGDGWMLQRGEKSTFNQTEVVTAKMNGALILIEGNGKDATTGKTVQTAMGVLTYDNIKQSYKWTAYSSGYIADMVPTVAKGSMVWTLMNPEGTQRYSISYNDTEWIEKGELSKDNGQTWSQNFEMKLKKVQ